MSGRVMVWWDVVVRSDVVPRLALMGGGVTLRSALALRAV